MEAINLALLVVGTLVFASVLAGLYSARAGLSFLLVFLVVGMLAGEDGPGGIRFDDFALSLWIGNAALAVILLDGGLRTRMKTFRTGLKPAAWLASVGVVVTAAITGVAASWLFALPLPLGLLAGAIVGSTDAAAVFSLLRTSGLRINERLSSTLEIESGLNDPMAVFLVIALIALQVQGAAEGGTAAALWLFANQLAAGLVIGLGAGFGAAALLLRAPLSDDERGLTALLLLAGGIATFGAAGALGGSGFLAVYLFGLIVANRASEAVERALSAMDGYAWFAQALLFLLLGLLVTPHLLLDKLAPALGVAAVLMFVARPVAVALCLVPLRIAWREIGFVSWVGLRGAVPVVLALFPVLAGVPQARVLFDIAFVVVLVSLVLQGATLARAARAFDVNLPEPGNERAERRLYGDFVLDGDASAADVFAFYGLPAPERDEALGPWCARRLRRAPVVGDRIDWGGASFTVRAMDGGRITRIGLVVEAASGPR
jgi:cell volume regulation protein A